MGFKFLALGDFAVGFEAYTVDTFFGSVHRRNFDRKCFAMQFISVRHFAMRIFTRGLSFTRLFALERLNARNFVARLFAVFFPVREFVVTGSFTVRLSGVKLLRARLLLSNFLQLDFLPLEFSVGFPQSKIRNPGFLPRSFCNSVFFFA